jgi:pimeloyl-ACP methyl ester carboxylesterase
MKRTFVILAVMALVLDLWLQAALAQPKVTPFTAIEISCSETPGDETTEGDITRHRGQLEETVWFSEEPLANGAVHEVIDWNYYASIDQGDYTGTIVTQPIDKAGALEGAFSGYWDAEGGSFAGYSFGTGELAGLEFYATGYPLAMDVALALVQDDPRVVDGNPCAPGPMPDIGEASVIYGYFVDRSAEVTAGAVEVNGAKLNYEMAGSGEPVILLHGWGGDMRDWDYLFAPLAEQYQVVRYDMRGFGKSDRPTTEPYSHIEDLKALMDELGIEQAHLIGQSYGGGIVFDFAVAHPEMTRSVIGSSPALTGVEMAYTAEEQAAIDASNAALEAAMAEGDWKAAAEALLLLPEFTTAARHPTAGARLVKMVEDFDWWPFFREDPLVAPEQPAGEHLDKVSAPVLVITGERTASIDLAAAEMIEKGIKGAKKVILPGVDHLAQLEAPDAFAAEVFEFLAAQ